MYGLSKNTQKAWPVRHRAGWATRLWNGVLVEVSTGAPSMTRCLPHAGTPMRSGRAPAAYYFPSSQRLPP